MSAVQRLVDEFYKIFDTKFKELVEDSWSNDRDGYSNIIQDNEDPTDEKAIVEQDVTTRFDEFVASFQVVADEDEAGKLLIFRCLQVPDVDEFLFHVAHGEPIEDPGGSAPFSGIGIFWSWDKEKAECHWGHGGETVTVNARAPFASIDPYQTLILNLSPTIGENEAEIRLKPGSKVEILGVETEDGYVSPLDEGFDPIEMRANIVRAFEERPMPVGPEPDGSFDRENQVVEIGMPEMNNIPLKEALINRPYYLGREQKFMPDPVKYPAMHRLLKADRYRPEPPAAAEPVMQYPEVEQVLKDNKEPT